MKKQWRKGFFFVVAGSILLLASGCSQRAWFQGFVEGQRFQCNKLSGRQRDICLERIITDFDRYQQERLERLRN